MQTPHISSATVGRKFEIELGLGAQITQMVHSTPDGDSVLLVPDQGENGLTSTASIQVEITAGEVNVLTRTDITAATELIDENIERTFPADNNSALFDAIINRTQAKAEAVERTARFRLLHTISERGMRSSVVSGWLGAIAGSAAVTTAWIVAEAEGSGKVWAFVPGAFSVIFALASTGAKNEMHSTESGRIVDSTELNAYTNAVRDRSVLQFLGSQIGSESVPKKDNSIPNDTKVIR